MVFLFHLHRVWVAVRRSQKAIIAQEGSAFQELVRLA
jgi:hypothetical protein